MRQKKCRAVACPRRVDRNELFCNVHLRQLPPRLIEPIADNREAPNENDLERIRIVATATNEAVTYLAKVEGRAEDLARARRSKSFEPGQGGRGGAPGDTGVQTGGGGGGRFDTDRIKPNLQ